MITNRNLKKIALFFLVVGAVAGFLYVRWSEQKNAAPVDTSSSAQGLYKEAYTKIDGLLLTSDKAEYIEYQRVAQFGSPWVSPHKKRGDCGTRNTILASSMADVVKSGCKVMSGTLKVDPYTGKKNIKLAQGDLRKYDGEHIVALKDAWVSGAQFWDKSGVPKKDGVSSNPQIRREELANDPLNVIIVSKSANTSKGFKDATAWAVPDNPGFKCEYEARQVLVKWKYGVPASGAEKAEFKKTMERCMK